MTVGVLAVLAMLFVMFAGFWTDWLWYRSVAVQLGLHQDPVDQDRPVRRLRAADGRLAVGLNIWLAHRLRPPLSAMSLEQQSLDRYRMGIAPYKKWVLLGVTALVGLISGASAAGQWRTWLMWVNGVSFGTKDPQFHKDISFYAFDLPWYRFLLSFGFAAAVLSLIAAALVHYLYGGLRLTTPGARATAQATGHLSVLLGVFVALKAVAYWLDRYGLAVKSGDFKATDNWTGLKYVDANAYLPAKTILFFIAIICALLFFATLWRRTWQLPVIGFGLMVLSAILIGGLYPAIVQKFQVQPNEQAKETPYIEKNIEATRDAYDIDDSQVRDYSGDQQGRQRAAARTRRTTPPACGCSTRTSSRRPSSRSSRSAGTTSSRRRWTWTATRPRTARSRTPSSVCGRSTSTASRRRTGSTSTSSTPTATAWSPPRAPRWTRTVRPAFTEKDLPPKGELGKYQGRGSTTARRPPVLDRRRPAEGARLRRRQRGEDLHLQGQERRQPLQPGQPRRLRA